LAAAPRRGWLERAEALGLWVENALLTSLLVALIAIAASQIVLRNAFSIGLVWADGLTRIIVLWLAVVGAVAATREDRHISINLAARFLPEGPRRFAAAAVSFFATGVAALLAWHAARFVADSREYGDVLLGTWPAWLFQLVLPIGFALMAYRFLLNGFKRLFGS